MIVNVVARKIYHHMDKNGGRPPASVYISQDLLDLLKEDMRNIKRRAGVADRPECEGDTFIQVVGVPLTVDPEMKLLRFE